MSSTEYLVARESFMAVLNGETVVVKQGEYVRAGHQLALEHPDKFQPLSISSRWDTVEQATAAPGEQRNTGRRGRRPAASTID